jgi:hypothetical protein
MKASQFVVNNIFIVIENPLGLPIGNKNKPRTLRRRFWQPAAGTRP